MLLLLAAFYFSVPSKILSQDSLTWNHPKALELIQRGRELRSKITIDSLFQNYQAEAKGHVYFFIDGDLSENRILVKADQVALDIFWQAPRQTKQIIVGQRTEKMLPTNIKYHLDHLTIVQDDFGDSFLLGGGDEIRGLAHPLSLNSMSIYDFQVSDSISISLPGSDNIKVYQLNVRPKNNAAPGVLGSIYLQETTGAVVRMNLTFTASSYIDQSLDYIRIITDNSVWNGKHWLPYDQKVEIRRESTLLDLPFGTTIQTQFRIRNYEFNQELPNDFFSDLPLISLPVAEKGQYIFDTGLLDGLPDANYTSSIDMDEIRKLALTLSSQRSLNSLNKSRFFIPTFSSVYRRNRAEGSFFGIGGSSLQLLPSWRLQSNIGYAKSAGSSSFSSMVTKGQTGSHLSLQLFWNNLNDVGAMLPGSSGAMNSLATVFVQQDYSDPYFSSGFSASKSWRFGTSDLLGITGTWEKHRSAKNVMVGYPPESGLNRPIIPIENGNNQFVEIRYSKTGDEGWLQTSVRGRIGQINKDLYTNFSANIQAETYSQKLRMDLKAWLRAGITIGANLPQFQYLLGGRHTLPGYGYRSFGGHKFGLLRTDISRSLWFPWMTLRVFGSTGVTGNSNLPTLDLKHPSPTNGLKTSVGMGLGLGWDLVHLDLGRGVDQGGGWEFILSVNHRFWKWL